PLAAALAASLTRVVDFGGGIAAPLWDGDSAAETSLLGQLLAPEEFRGVLTDRARTWFEARPGSLAWVCDDAGGIDAMSGEPISRIGVANLGAGAMVTWAGVGGVRNAGD